MKKILLLSVVSGLILCVTGYSFGDTIDYAKTLLLYEEKNEQIDPWVKRFSDALKAVNKKVDIVSTAEIKGKNLSQYTTIVIYGVVQAFTFKGPIRDWLKTDVDFTGKKVYLAVTANRWFLNDYFKQLQNGLKKSNADVINAVSGATQKMSEGDKQSFVKSFIAKIR
jgi:major membrane immunogen (membrane-anchored lipoprotein)